MLSGTGTFLFDVSAFSLINLFGLPELFLLLREQIKQGFPLDLILFLGQALSKILDI
ncbi:hypothetical protein ACVDG8_000065 [Mesorhizobium sp. ORM8.1]